MFQGTGKELKRRAAAENLAEQARVTRQRGVFVVAARSVRRGFSVHLGSRVDLMLFHSELSQGRRGRC